MSTIKGRIKTLELSPGVLVCKLPIDFCVQIVPSVLPCRHFSLHLSHIVNPSVQTLPDEHVQLNLSHVQPTAVLGGIHKLKPVPQRLGHGGRKRLVEGTGAMGIEIIHHEGNLVGAGVLPRNGVQKGGPLRSRFSLRDLDEAGARQRFDGHEHIAHPAALVFVVIARRRPSPCRQRGPGGPNQLPGRFVHAHHGIAGIVGALVHIEHVLHLGHKGAVLRGGNDPLGVFPRLHFVFLVLLI